MDGTKLSQTIQRIESPDKSLIEETQRRLDNLTKPVGSLGRLESLACRLVAVTGKRNPTFRQKRILVLAADHGVVAEGVSAYPQEVTAQMVANFLNGGAAINVLARQAGAKVVVADFGVASDLPAHAGLVSRKIGYGTRNFLREPAMSREQAIAAVEAGIELVEGEIAAGADLIGAGEMGIGNTTAASAVTAVMTGASVAQVTGYGAGINVAQRDHKIAVIQQAIEHRQPNANDPLDVLTKLGGFEIGGIAGVFLGAVAHRVPAIVDGFISTAGALIAVGLCPSVAESLFCAHSSAESGHVYAMKSLGLTPLLDLGLRLGEGTGAALAMPLFEMSARVLAEMASFDSAGVSRKTDA